jgi:hypothetical protein
VVDIDVGVGDGRLCRWRFLTILFRPATELAVGLSRKALFEAS